eukprot:CAMPEP_0197418308 /NCGR_PEP_ID=MMETSP1170-20131217/4078_1 /TAXON_ID=54406 /ORGANISM="Sarcinochrysis sp, Strain CCMP770" /LENGTH=65 /DNA_ID=CAMNT_0042945337 /DNA_START=18 /DNA_END=215 /DNA_ORIENTATION=-
MTTRQVFSIAISCLLFGHSISLPALVGAAAVFGSIFHRIKRQAKAAQDRRAAPSKPSLGGGGSKS